MISGTEQRQTAKYCQSAQSSDSNKASPVRWVSLAETAITKDGLPNVIYRVIILTTNSLCSRRLLSFTPENVDYAGPMTSPLYKIYIMLDLANFVRLYSLVRMRPVSGI